MTIQLYDLYNLDGHFIMRAPVHVLCHYVHDGYYHSDLLKRIVRECGEGDNRCPLHLVNGKKFIVYLAKKPLAPTRVEA